MKKFLLGLLLPLTLFAQSPAISLMGPITEGDKTIQGAYTDVAPDSLSGFTLESADRSNKFNAVIADFTINLQQRTFTATSKSAFTAKEQIRVSLPGTKVVSTPLTVQAVPPLNIQSVQAFYGTSSITINFSSGSPTVKISAQSKDANCNPATIFETTVTIPAKDIAAGASTISLPQALVTKSGLGTLQLLINDKEYPVLHAVVNVAAPLHDGDKTITGTAGPTVKKVCVAVFAEGHEAPPTNYVYPPTSCSSVYKRLASLYKSAADVALKADKKTAEADLEPFRQRYSAQANGLSAITLKETVVQDSEGLPKRKADESAHSAIEYSGPLLEQQEMAVDANAHTFTFNLQNGLTANSTVFVREVFSDNPEGELVSFNGPQPITVDPTGLDLGRVRAYLTVGASLSESSKSFGQADPYVCFKVDGNFFSKWIRHNYETYSKKYDGGTKPPQNYDLFDKSPFGMSIHWTASIALNQTGAVSADSVSLSPSQSTLFQAGLYVPMRVSGMDWTYQGLQYSAYIAPIVKGGATVVKDGVALSMSTTTVSTTLTSCTASCTLAPTSTVAFARSTGPAPFTAYGLRVGVMKYTVLGNVIRNRQIASDPVIYLDVTWGKNQVYPTPGAITTSAPKVVTDGNSITTTTVTTQSFDFKTRVALEGRIKLPYLPAELGADVNFNWKNPVRGLVSAPTGDAIASINYTDFRLILGFHFDVAKAMSTILGAGKATN